MRRNSAILGAAFLMATSAIGPGFLTQTTKFTAELLASFGFIILISLLIDIGAQVNIWRIITVSNSRAQEIANSILPGLGTGLAGLIGFGGLVFNIGNFAGCGLGLQALFEMDMIPGIIFSVMVSLGIFWYREAGKAMDMFAKILGLMMIGLTLYIAISSSPPVQEAVYRTVWPEKIDVFIIVTLVGGTVGGYITFAGAHRLLDAGIHGIHSLPQVTRSSVSGILITSVMRFILFFAALGVVWQGTELDQNNPAGSVFRSAAGNIGYKFFGLVMWSAAITSVVGASYTSISFFRSRFIRNEKYFRVTVTIFILISATLFLLIGNPVKLLILAGAINGLILPVALAVILIAARKKKIIGNYHHPAWMLFAGWLVVLLMSWMGFVSVVSGLKSLF